MNGSSLGAVRGGAFAIRFEQVHDPRGRLERLVCGFGHAGEEKVQPGLPVARLAHTLQEPVILGAIGLQRKAEVEQRASQNAMDSSVR